MKAFVVGAAGPEFRELAIDRIFPFSEAQAALAHMRANAHFGKIVLAI